MEPSERIKELRTMTGLNRREFAEHLKIPLRTIEDWEAGRRTPPEYVVRLIAYQIKYEGNCLRNALCASKVISGEKRNVSVVCDTSGNKIVVIHDTIFMGKQNICWKDVESYLKRYVDEFYTIAESGDIVYIGKDLPDEYSGSKYTAKLKGTAAKAKANAAQAIPELIQISTHKSFADNREEKHQKDAKYGWYRFDSRFALAVYDNDGEIQKYNVFKVRMIIRHGEDDKKYLYDIIDIKKETEYPA